MIKDDIHVKVLKVFQVLSLMSWEMRREMLSCQLEVDITKNDIFIKLFPGEYSYEIDDDEEEIMKISKVKDFADIRILEVRKF